MWRANGTAYLDAPVYVHYYILYNEGLVIDKKKGYMMVPEQIQTADHTVLKNFIVYSLSIRLPRYLTLCLDGAILNL